MLQILNGVDFLHSKKILHRDLKPANILIDNKTLSTKLADFGLSRIYSFPIRPFTKEVLTLWYRAPELMLGFNNYSFDLDMWSVGCIFCEIMLGKPLIHGDAEIDQLFRMFKIFGTPTDETLPGYTTFPDFNKNFPLYKPRGIRKELEQYKLDSQLVDLIEKLLVVDPCKRMTAKEAIKHPYFDAVRHLVEGRNTNN